MSNAKAVTDATFAAEVLNEKLPVLVDFWADWCAPCRQLAPILDELSKEYEGRIVFTTMDTNANLVTPAQHGVMNLPTIMVFSGGEPVKIIKGAATKMALRKALDEVA